MRQAASNQNERNCSETAMFGTAIFGRYCAGAVLLLYAMLAIIPARGSERLKATNIASGKGLPWYVTAAAMHRMMLKSPNQIYIHEQLSLDLKKAAGQLRELEMEGVDSLDVYAPEEGATSYGGLDAKDRYRLDPGIGSVDDLRRVIREAHGMGMHVITSQNLGYAALDAPQFLKAEDDIRARRTSREAEFFFWSKSADAPPPGTSDSYFLLRPSSLTEKNRTQFWQWSDRAQSFFWTRWPGKDSKGETTHLPQYNWAGSAWPDEAAKVVDFWMGTGLDGMVVDAVNWYIGYDWLKNAALVATYNRRPGAKLILAEGGGAFHTDDPTGWILDGKWTALYDYGIDIPWEKNNRPIIESINSANPEIFEQSLRNYHDRVVAAGGILVGYVVDLKDPQKQKLSEELIATSGDLPCYCGPDKVTNHPAPGVSKILKLKAKHPALYQNSLRRRVQTDQDQSVYATERYAADNSERLLVIFNFSPDSKEVTLDARAVYGTQYEDLESGNREKPTSGNMRLTLAGYGHRIFRITE